MLCSAVVVDGLVVVVVDVAVVLALPPPAKWWAYFVCLQRGAEDTAVGTVVVGLYSLGM